MTEADLVSAPPARPSRRGLLIGSAVALVAAGAVAVLFVLPAEYGIDPTGAGKALGLVEMAKPENIYLKRGQARKNTLFPLEASARPDEATLRATLSARGIAWPAAGTVRTDRFEFELLPYEGIELKYDLAQGAPMIFAWKASTPVHLDMHSHPFKGGTDLTESFVISELPAQTGVYVAPFTGIHGWYWQNRTLDNVTLTLDATGLMTGSRIFNEAGEHPRPLSDEPAAASGGTPPPAT